MSLVVISVVVGVVTASTLAVVVLRSRRYRRDAERRLRDASAHLHGLIDHSSSAIYLKDRQRRYLLANRRHIDLWPEMRGFQAGMTPADFFPAETARAFAESDDLVFRSGDVHTFEEAIPHTDGPHTYVSSKFPVRDESGAIIAVGGISTDITDLKRAQATVAQKEALLRRLIDIQESEKQRLCAEFHDGLIQYTVGSKMLLESLDVSRLPADCAEVIVTVIGNLGRGLEDGRRVIRGIRPAALDDLGLAAALDELCAQPEVDGPRVEAVIDPAVDAAPEAVQTTAYRVVQEALTNAIRHARAQDVRVTVRLEADGLHVVVADSGRGFDVHARDRSSFGLVGMEERVRLAGGEFGVASEPGAGTRVTARIPLDG